jgi:putative flavoprotein involved in K+ transport
MQMASTSTSLLIMAMGVEWFFPFTFVFIYPRSSCTATHTSTPSVMKRASRALENNEPSPSLPEDLSAQVIVVGAGASGIGAAQALKDFGVKDVLILEGSEEIGGSFVEWPAEMRLITPSFNHNAHGMMDLNSVVIGTSPSLGPFDHEHLSGIEYAQYLEFLVKQGRLRVAMEVTVTDVTLCNASKSRKDSASKSNAAYFELDTSAGTFTCRYVVWAAGEFQYPAEGTFDGAELCQHNSEVESWKDLQGSEHVVIGGYESGIDATVNLAKHDKAVTVIGRRASWAQRLPDPSLELAPYTRQRLREARESSGDKLRLVGNREVYRVSQDKKKKLFTVHTRPAHGTRTRPGKRGEEAASGATSGQHHHGQHHATAADEKGDTDGDVPWELTCPNPPILANGFEGSVAALIKPLFQWTKPGGPCGTSDPILSDVDESTKTAGLFLCGPQVRHEGVVFCFIFKFRQRFAIVANAIAGRLGLSKEKTKEVEDRYRKAQMFLDDLECCKENACGPAC